MIRCSVCASTSNVRACSCCSTRYCSRRCQSIEWHDGTHERRRLGTLIGLEVQQSDIEAIGDAPVAMISDRLTRKMAISPDSKRLAVNDNAAVRIYNLEAPSRAPLVIEPDEGGVGAPIFDFAWAPDSSRIVVSGEDFTQSNRGEPYMRVYSLDYNNDKASLIAEKKRRPGKNQLFGSLDWSPDGETILVVEMFVPPEEGEDSEGEEIDTLNNTYTLTEFSIDANNRLESSINVLLDDLLIDERLATSPGGAISAIDARYSPDGTAVAISAIDNFYIQALPKLAPGTPFRRQMEIFEQSQKKVPVRFPGEPRWSPDSSYVIFVDNGRARVVQAPFKSAPSDQLKEISDATTKIFAVAPSSSRGFVATANDTSMLHIWRVSGGNGNRFVRAIELPRGTPSSFDVAWSRDGTTLVARSEGENNGAKLSIYRVPLRKRAAPSST